MNTPEINDFFRYITEMWSQGKRLHRSLGSGEHKESQPGSRSMGIIHWSEKLGGPRFRAHLNFWVYLWETRCVPNITILQKSSISCFGQVRAGMKTFQKYIKSILCNKVLVYKQN